MYPNCFYKLPYWTANTSTYLGIWTLKGVADSNLGRQEPPGIEVQIDWVAVQELHLSYPYRDMW